MLARALLLIQFTLGLITLGLGAGCEKTDHGTIDKWTRTETGPGKLKKALTDEGLDADLSAHAASNLVRMGKDPDVRAAFETMSPARKAQVVDKLAPRLWELARIEREDALPATPQTVAKDALIQLRKHATEAQKQQIDAYLIDWYGVLSYEGRAKVGSTLGAAAMRMVGPAGGKKLIAVLNGVIAAPGQGMAKLRIGDELLLGLAASGNPEAVKYVLDLARMDRGDPTLAKRAINALRTAYVDPQGLFELADPAALAATVPDLVAIAKDDRMIGRAGNDAIELLRVVGAPACIAPLVDLIPFPHPEKNFRYAVAYAALKCGGPAAIGPVVKALPADAPYAQEAVAGAITGQIAKLTPRAHVLEQVRALLDDPGTISKWVAAESLAAMESAEDAPRIAALAGRRDRLTGFWGDQFAKETKVRKADPTLGERAKELAAALGAAK